MAKAIRSTRGYIYFLHAKEVRRIKIGFTTNLNARLRELKMGSPTELILFNYVRGTFHLEQVLLGVFAKYRLHGEWFESSEDIIKFVEKLETGTFLSPEKIIKI